jgi:cytochrome P450
MEENETEKRTEGKCPFSPSVLSIDRHEDVKAVLRSTAVVADADVSCDNYVSKNPLAETNVREFQDNILSMINGDAHRHRRRLLNSLVRPEALVRFREDVVMPSVDRWLAQAVKPTGEGLFGCDLAAVVELVFLEFAAKLIGLQGIGTEEGLLRLRSCALPVFAALSARHFGDREAVTQAGLAAKKVFVEEYFEPSYAFCKSLAKRVAAGEVAEEDVAPSLLWMVVKGADAGYLDRETAVREAILFFVATTGTSVQAILSTVEDLSGWIAQHPEDVSRLDDLEFVSNALQESLRLKAPYVSYLTRLAVEDIDVNSCRIKAGDEIHAFIARAGKDVSVFGPDAVQFNPLRVVPGGVSRYGLAFGSGQHQCLGLRAVLGNDGNSGGHVRLLQALFRAGVRPDPARKPQVLAMGGDEAQDNIPTYTSYPVVFTNWAKTQ